MRRRGEFIHDAFDPAAAGPPIPGVPGHDGLYTMRPSLGVRRGPPPITSLTDGVLRDFLNRRSRRSQHIREALRRDMRHLRRLVGGENIELSFTARAAVSTDSTGLRGLVSEAVFFPPDVPSVQALVSWCFHHRVPLIPYGAGSGYNMGVVPLAPAVTVSLACLGEIGPVRSNPGAQGRASHIISAGAGARYADVVRTVSDHGLTLRCLPNSPRAAVGGIAATGSNGGRRIGEVVLGGEAVLADGTLVRFVADEEERAFWTRGRFPMVHKFHGVPRDPAVLRRMIRDADVLPASLFVGSEGTTGILTRVDLELERPGRHALTAAVWLRYLDDVPSFVQRVREFSSRPTYFELLTQPAIGRYLTKDFADLFDGDEQAYVIVSFEEDEEPLLTGLTGRLHAALPAGSRVRLCGPYPSHIPPPEARRLSAPREELPRRLVSKCKTDMEVLLEALPRVIPLLASPRTREGDLVESILFGHLSAGASAILHWNIGGVDLTVEESAARGWRHLERMLGEAAGAEPGSSPDAVFTGEHGSAGRPWLLREALRRQELAWLLRVKRAVDPRGVVNPAKLFLPTRMARTIRGRALASAPVGPLAGVGAIVNRCTRCNACQNCLVMESQIAVRARRPPRSRGSVISGKRGLLYLLELLASSDVPDDELPRFLGDACRGMAACISCGRCDADCPASITLKEIAEAMQRPVTTGSWRSRLLHRLFLAPTPRAGTLWGVAALQRAMRPLSRLVGGSVPRSLVAYAALPGPGWHRYPRSGRPAAGVTSDLTLVGDTRLLALGGEVMVRFKGCVGTVGQADASLHEDAFFRAAGIPFLDFSPDMCCGFPFTASGDLEAARARRDALLRRICAAARAACGEYGVQRAVIVSSCPTCQESLRMAQTEAGGSTEFFVIADPAEYVVNRTAHRVQSQGPGETIGLKVPCHATPQAASSQMRLLAECGYQPVRLDQCCGMAGIGRIEHPDVGLVLAERLSGAIRAAGIRRVVSGCPSCRDGLRLQSTLERSDLEVTDLFGLLRQGSINVVAS